MAKVGTVVDGVLEDANNAITSTKKDTKGTGELGKDAFLQLLVCQIQNQDPLNPQDDTQFVSQLATFSQLEQMQNLNASYEKSQAFSLIGKDVIINTEDSTGKETQVSGKVQYVNASGANVQIYVNGELYDLDDLYAVMDEDYMKSICAPKVDKTYKFTYDAEKPGGLVVEVSLGEDDYAADEVALVINNKLVDPKNFKLDGTKLIISGETFAGLANGSYAVAVVFNDKDYTTVEDKIAVTVVNSKVEPEPPKEEGDKTEGDDKTDKTDKDETPKPGDKDKA